MVDRVMTNIRRTLSNWDCELPAAAHEDVAKTVLATLREPTEEMVSRGASAFQTWEDDNDGLVRSAALGIYRAMIDASCTEE